MTTTLPLTLNEADPLVMAAREAEARLYADYGLSAPEQYVVLPGQGIRVRIVEMGSAIGNGPPLVIVPGNTGDAFPLASLMQQLPGRRLIAINRPGGGLSEGMDHRNVDIRSFAVNTLTTILDALGLGQVDVLAHSMGAHWSFYLAMDRPERVRRLVTLGNPGNVMNGNAPLMLRLLAKPPLNRLLMKLVVPRKREKSLGVLRMMGHSATTVESQPLAFGDCYFHFRRLPHYALSSMSLLANLPPSLGAADLARVLQPVALLWGSKDTFAGLDVGRSVAQALPQGGLHALDGAGHLPWLEDPEVCGRLIREFLER
jgi:pimeloyl-ACP methyl ester carboxylesterase